MFMGSTAHPAPVIALQLRTGSHAVARPCRFFLVNKEFARIHHLAAGTQVSWLRVAVHGPAAAGHPPGSTCPLHQAACCSFFGPFAPCALDELYLLSFVGRQTSRANQLCGQTLDCFEVGSSRLPGSILGPRDLTQRAMFQGSPVLPLPISCQPKISRSPRHARTC